VADETIFKIKLATISSLGVAILSLLVTVLIFWVGGISRQNDTNTTDIATLKQAVVSMKDSTERLVNGVETMSLIVTDIRLRQAEHYGISTNNNQFIKKVAKKVDR
jgi:hypothetical protein